MATSFRPPSYAHHHSIAAYDVYDAPLPAAARSAAVYDYAAHDPYRAPTAPPRAYEAWSAHSDTAYDDDGTESQRRVRPYRNYGLGQGSDEIGGPAACTTIAVLTGFYALFSHPDKIDMINVMENAAIMWRRDSRVFQNVTEVFKQTPQLSKIVCIARDDNAEIRGNARPRHKWSSAEREPAFMLRTVAEAVDVLDAAQRAIAAMSPEKRRSPTLPPRWQITNAVAVLTSNEGSTLLIATPAGDYYEFDSHGSASLYHYTTRTELERSITDTAWPDTSFTLTVLALPHVSTLGIVL